VIIGMTSLEFVDDVEKKGFSIVPAVLDAGSLAELQLATEAFSGAVLAAGVRNLAGKAPAVAKLARDSRIRDLVEPILGAQSHLVRSILFNKDATTNWQVAWHQDLSIAVQARAEVPEFSRWSVKEGVPHVQPPISVLERMLTVRIHLDAADESNGALLVSPGSHRFGRLASGDAGVVARRNGERLCAVDAGGALLFRPLILHCSRKATSSRPRRIIHLEFSNASLPEPLRWAENHSGLWLTECCQG
jgi:ectoine hydroxylase-related dioxygenase (phytanoyl-CoA dioxygenase family)